MEGVCQGVDDGAVIGEDGGGVRVVPRGFGVCFVSDLDGLGGEGEGVDQVADFAGEAQEGGCGLWAWAGIDEFACARRGLGAYGVEECIR